MTYTEIKERNGKKYYYRSYSVRQGDRIMKKRIYLGCSLSSEKLHNMEIEADNKLVKLKTQKSLKKIEAKIATALKKYNVKKAGIFGSYAKGNQKKNSDIDILIEPPKGMGLKFVSLALELEEKLGKKVDLVSYNGIHPLLKKRILKEEKPIIYGR